MTYQIEPGRLIRMERNRAGLTLDDLAAAIACSKAQLSQMETGGRTISEDRAAAIENALSIKDGRIVAAVRWAVVPPALRDQVHSELQASRSLASSIRDAMETADPVRALRKIVAAEDARATAATSSHAESPREMPLRALASLGRIPVINKVAAGYPAEFTDLDYPASVADEYIACPDVNDPHAFAARVVGDSMEPDYKQGEIVVFSPALPTPSGSDCFVRLDRDNETTFKRVFFEGEREERIRLQPINAKYPPTVLHREHVTGLWAAAYVMRRVTGKQP